MTEWEGIEIEIGDSIYIGVNSVKNLQYKNPIIATNCFPFLVIVVIFFMAFLAFQGFSYIIVI